MTEPPETEEDDDEDLPFCDCGHTRHHLMVSPEPEYTAWGTFWVTLMGVSATPIRLRFRCRICKLVFDMTDDPSELRSFL